MRKSPVGPIAANSSAPIPGVRSDAACREVQEEVGLDEFLSNRFGAFYDTSLSPKLVWDYDSPAEAAE